MLTGLFQFLGWLTVITVGLGVLLAAVGLAKIVAAQQQGYSSEEGKRLVPSVCSSPS